MDQLRALRYVTAVAEDLSFSRAARRLWAAQPTLSRAIRAFEDAHGVVLFDRSARSVTLTDAGRVLLPAAAAAIDQAARAVAAAQGVAAGVEGRVRLGFVTGAANTLLPHVVAELRSRRPGLEVELRHLSVDEQVTALRQRRLDVGLLRLPSDVTTAQLVVEVLVPDQLVAAVPAGGPLDRAGPLQWDDLRDETFVFWPRAMARSLYDHIFRHLYTVGGLSPRIAWESRDTLALLALVAAGVGVTLVTTGTAEAVNRSGVGYRPLPDPPDVTLAMAHRPDPAPAAAALIEACRVAASPT